jgi:hypothetical protein
MPILVVAIKDGKKMTLKREKFKRTENKSNGAICKIVDLRKFLVHKFSVVQVDS